MYAGAVSMKRVLLTGENGFLGKRVRSNLEAVPGVELRLLGKRLTELEPAELRDVDDVVHLAAWTTKRAGASDLERMTEANVMGLRALLGALDVPPRRFLFASTADVYGMTSGEVLDEGSPLDPTDAYAASKLLGEHMVAEDAHARDYEFCVVRIAHLYGPGEESYEKFVPASIRALMKGRPPTVVGDGQTERDLLYVDDAAEAIRRLLTFADELPVCVNLAAPEFYTLEAIARTLIGIVGFMGSIRYLSDHANPPSVRFDTALLEGTVGTWQRIALGDGLRHEIEHVVALEGGSTRALGYV
jgi:UDP-glucose 4-epimerase